MCDSYKMNFGDEVCRSCLTNAEHMKSLNDTYSTEMCVADVFTCITSLKCSGDNDVLPTQICHECFDELHWSYQFVLKSQKSDKKLQAYLNNIHKTNDEIVADNTRNISDITITVQSDNATNLTATTLMNPGQNMSNLIEGIQLDVKTELNTLSNDLSNRDLSTENGLLLEEYESNDNIYEHSYAPIRTLRTPLLIAEMQEGHEQELDLIKHEIGIDVKIAIANDINYKDNILINNEPANEQDIAIASEINPQSNKITNIIISDIKSEMKNEIDDYFITNCQTRSQCKQTSTVTSTEINKIPTANIEISSSDHEHVQVLAKVRRYLEIQDERETENVCINPAESEYTCAICNKSFHLKENLIVHTRTHTGQMPYTCEFCFKIFSGKSHLVRHTRTHTRQKPYTCTVCIMSFNRKAHLVNHTRTHTGEKPFACEVCLKTFSEKTHLVRHMRTHTGEKPFSCKICLKTFSVNANLLQHTRTHTEIKPYVCKVCPKTFNEKTSLVSHMRTHIGMKPYPCTVCIRSFNRKAHLVHHTRTHTGEKPYECEVCLKTFCEKTHLVRHTRTHTR